jgi:hypothetical protein
MQVVRTFSDDTHMEIGLDICAKIVLKRGKISSVTKFNTWLKQRNTRARTGEKISNEGQMKGGHTSSNERKFEEEIHQKIKNDTEIRVKYQ